MAAISAAEMEEMDLDALCWLVIDDAVESMRKDEEEAEEEERRKREPRGKGRKRKEATKKKAEAVAKSDCKVGKVDASSRPATAKAEAARVKKSDGKVAGAEASGSRKKTTEIDLPAAAAYRAELEEADRKQQRTKKFSALKKWVATGDPEARLYWERWYTEEMEAMEAMNLADTDPTEDWSDPNAVEAQRFRDFWNEVWRGLFGSFEDTTPIRPMRYTDKKPEPDHTETAETLQVFSVRVAEIKGEIKWPLDVFGIIAARDCLDNNRNIIFDRKRDDCQTINKESPYLTLTGPTRAVVVLDPACFEVMLRVKGTTESEDRDLSFLVVWDREFSAESSYVVSRVETSKLSTLELTYGHIVKSVEATISVKVIGAKLPDGFRGGLTANTTGLDDMKVLLLAFGDDKSPVAADGMIQLSRRVVCVELEGELSVSVMAQCDEGQVEGDSKVFKPKESSRSYAVLEVCSCKMEVTVAWSLLSYSHYLGGSACTDTDF